MRYRYLPIIPLLAFSSVNAQVVPGIAMVPRQQQTQVTVADEVATAKAEGAANVSGSDSTGRKRAGGVDHTCFFANVDIGYAHSMFKANDVSKRAMGALFRVEYGAKFAVPARRPNNNNFFSASLAYTYFSANQRHKDTVGPRRRGPGYQFTAIGIPLSYTSVHNRDVVGYYWQVGASFNYLSKAEIGDNDISGHFNKFFVSPAASAGMSVLFESTRGRKKSGNMLIGMFAEDAVTNLARDRGESIHGFAFGLRCTIIKT